MRSYAKQKRKMLRLDWLVALLTCTVLTSPTVRAQELRILPKSAHDLKLTAIDSGWQLETTGVDPYFVTELPAESLIAESCVLEFEYVCAVAIKQPHLFFGPPLIAKNYFALPALRQAEGWHRYAFDLSKIREAGLPPTTRQIRLDFGSDAGVTIRVRNLQLRPRNEQEVEANAQAAAKEFVKQQSAQRISQYLKTPPTQRIQSVHVMAEAIVIEADATIGGLPRLVEFPIDQSIGDDRPGMTVDAECQEIEHRLRWQIPRRAEYRDRLNSGFALVSSDDATGLLTPRTFATSFAPPTHPVATPPKPKNQKGLSGLSHGGPNQDLSELGISAVTINFVLNRFVTDFEGSHCERIPVTGSPVYFDANAFVGMDELFRLAKQHDLVVSAILLITNRNRTKPTSPLIHPEVDGGTYAMPDLMTPRGAAVYAFVLDKIAQRYRDPTSDLGGITNWIAHNEVDFHNVWTNFGKQPREVATETYYRSLRMIHNTARQYQPDARVFASLTHHWVVPDDGAGLQLSPREVLETLQRYSVLENDFAWGVAYHPYPESLFAAVAWEDKSPTDDFDTPLITIQNLPVLGRFLEQPTMRDSNGNQRPVILSEQGFHTADDSDAAQRRQAESLQFAMQQVRKLSIVESFHYHRWMDHPDEGGLNLGLRTTPTATHPHGLKKQAWEAYRNE